MTAARITQAYAPARSSEPAGLATEIHRLDHRHVWHPFAQMHEYLNLPPLAIAEGRGGWLIDTEGREYLDGNASVWTNVHGHNDPDLNAALIAQIGKVAHSTMLGLAHAPGAELAAELVKIAPPGLGKVFYSDNGSNAVEIALKMSFQFWQLKGRPEKRGVIGLAGAYHGDTFGAMAVGDSGFFHERFRAWCFPTQHFPAPLCREWAGQLREAHAETSLDALRALLAQQASQTACVILEPSVQGAAGMQLQPPGFVHSVAQLCREYGVHLILDEVFVAFGRLGKMIVATDENVTPDFLCLAKGLTGGYLPLAATMVRDEIFEAFLGSYESSRAFFHGHTFTGNPLGCAVALANLQKLQPLVDNGVLANRIVRFGRRLDEIFAEHPRVREIRQRGFAAALDLVPDRTSAEHFPVADRIGLQVCLRARDHGLLIRPLGDSLLLVPAPGLPENELDEVVRRTACALDDLLPP